MAKTKKAKPSPKSSALIRSNQNLIALGLFSIALLIGVFMYFDGNMFNTGTSTMQVQERTIRVQTEPARLTTTDSNDLNQVDQTDAMDMNDEANGY